MQTIRLLCKPHDWEWCTNFLCQRGLKSTTTAAFAYLSQPAIPPLWRIWKELLPKFLYHQFFLASHCKNTEKFHKSWKENLPQQKDWCNQSNTQQLLVTLNWTISMFLMADHHDHQSSSRFFLAMELMELLLSSFGACFFLLLISLQQQQEEHEDLPFL